jgi:tetratricopeptide (TPR) repeat protein
LGSTEGFIAFMIRIPETNSLVVILCNSAPTDFFGITKNLIKVIYNKPVILKEPAHKKMESVIAASNAEKAIVAYKEMKADTAHFYVDWLQLYFLGEKLLSLKRYDDARIITENNVAEFPERDLVALSMANIYLALGKKDLAVKFYEKTLLLNPQNEEAKNRLKELK